MTHDEEGHEHEGEPRQLHEKTEVHEHVPVIFAAVCSHSVGGRRDAWSVANNRIPKLSGENLLVLVLGAVVILQIGDARHVLAYCTQSFLQFVKG